MQTGTPSSTGRPALPFEIHRNYSGTLAPINWSRYFIFINNLLIYKSVQQQVLKLFFHDTINIQIRGLNLVKFINTLLLLYIIILF